MSIFSDFDANCGSGQYNGMPGIDGGTDILHDGVVVDHTEPMGTSFDHGDFVIKTANQEGGTDVFRNGTQAVHTEHNIMGGEDVYHGNELSHVTIPNQEGGVDVYDGHMQQQGISMPNEFGSEDYLSFQGNSNELMQYEDPLAHVSDYRMEPFDVNA